MKGKNFNAAEKHFEKKRVQLERRIKDLNEQVENAHRAYYDYRFRAELLERENEELKDWVERLLQYTELPLEDIKAACEKDKAAAKNLEWIMSLGRVSALFMGGAANEPQ